MGRGRKLGREFSRARSSCACRHSAREMPTGRPAGLQDPGRRTGVILGSNFSSKASMIERSTTWRVQVKHICPALRTSMLAAHSGAASVSASSKMMNGDLPLNSRLTGTTHFEPRRALIAQPVHPATAGPRRMQEPLLAVRNVCHPRESVRRTQPLPWGFVNRRKHCDSLKHVRRFAYSRL